MSGKRSGAKRKGAKRVKFGKRQRGSRDWHPDRELRKLFGVTGGIRGGIRR